MEITFDSIIGILGLLLGGGAGGFFTWRWQRVKAKAEAKEKEAEAKSAEVDMAQKVQDTYQQILDDKQKEVDDNHRLIAELREDRDHYKQGYVEFRDKLDKLDNEFRTRHRPQRAATGVSAPFPVWTGRLRSPRARNNISSRGN